MEQFNNNSAQNLGVAALITAILTFILAVIPCVGLIAIVPGIIAIVLAAVGLSHASRTDAPRGTLIAGLIIAIVACMISSSQIFVAKNIARNADDWSNKIEEVVEDVQDNVIRELEEANVSIKVESDGQVVEINTTTRTEDKEKTLEELEGITSTDSTEINN
jgi:hypothetical protein